MMKKILFCLLLLACSSFVGCESELEKKIVFKNSTVKNVMDQVELVSKKYDYKIIDRNNELNYMKILMRRFENTQPGYTQTHSQTTTVKTVEEILGKKNDFVPPGIAKKDNDPEKKPESKDEPVLKVTQTNNYGKEVYVPAKTTVVEYSVFVEFKKVNNGVEGYAYFRAPGEAQNVSQEFIQALKKRIDFEVIDLNSAE